MTATWTAPEPTAPPPHALVRKLEAFEGLDGAADVISKKLRDALARQPLKDLLSGTWLGHSLHPLMTDLPIGTWTSALLLDLLGGEDAEGASDLLVGVGLAAAGPTALAGWSDWADSTVGNKPVSRVGLVHAASNITALGLYTASLLARRRGARRRGKLLGLAGAGALGLGGYLGGHLSFVRGIGVNQTAFEGRPGDWTEAAGASQLTEGRPHVATVEGADVLLVRQGERVFALANTCTHRGGPLSDGELVDGCVECPWHGSRFRLADGSVEQGPASAPQPAYDVRERDGRVEVRAHR
ncbi:MAG: Rieske (2Fe-2S) protein [Actinomycetota bacterium]|nr:Rieske (2Fe-2S) protein [Actinomycetota bacterium]MDQ3647545.1 Rieske (2Fe-2S) protein [Actinomycetota bacterium]